jgi:hypothetical protein
VIAASGLNHLVIQATGTISGEKHPMNKHDKNKTNKEEKWL